MIQWILEIDLLFVCLFKTQLVHLEVFESHATEAFLKILSITLLAFEMSAIVW